jgi:hypothetical protein
MTEKETETVTIYRDCEQCGGIGYTCDYMCYMNTKKHCQHRTRTGCGCDFGEVNIDIEIPKSVVEKYYDD